MSEQYSNILDRFLQEYMSWCDTGTEPSAAGRDVRYCLDAQEKRLKSRGVQVHRVYETSPDAIHNAIGRDRASWHVSIPYREVRSICEYRYGKNVKKYSEPVVFYASVLDRTGSEDHVVNCPSCGYVTMASALQDGCPYCHTVFTMQELWPKVTSWYTVSQIAERETLNKRIPQAMWIIAGLSFIILFLISFLLTYPPEEYVLWARVLISLFTSAFGAAILTLVSYMSYSFFLLIKILVQAGKTVPLLGGLNSPKKMQKFMNDPEFSYELFEGKVISLLRGVLFSDTRDDLCIYSGHDDLSRFNDLIDLDYRGVLKIRSTEYTGDLVTVTVDAYLTCTYMRRKVTRRDEKITLTLERKAEIEEDPGFSVHAVKCRGCQASFDAMHIRYCPNCGRRYELTGDDWVIASIED